MAVPPDNEPIRSDFADDPDMSEIVEMFVHELPDRIAMLESTWTCGDLEAIGRLAHQLKGCCAGYGFAVIGNAAASLERTLLDTEHLGNVQPETIRTQVDDLITLCRRATGG